DLDIFHDEDVAYAQRLKESGVECELEVVEGAFHGFDVFDLKIALVQKFRRSQMTAMKKYLAM
ncbi:MAG TPA: alpha/beta hydrolase fold domain-containing protein, partial [Anaerolineales bacterium]|nr:alpha/beta hydrolase fold domain-containing protein [Anaerolineales bacterium]